jgi:hypothetical protein
MKKGLTVALLIGCVALVAWRLRPAAASESASTTTPSATIRGRCVADEDGRPLAGCVVQADPPWQTIRTGADGAFEFAVDREKNVTLWLRHKERAARVARFAAALPARIELGDVRLARGFTARGRVVDDAGRGLSPVQLLAFGIGDSLRGSGDGLDVTGATTEPDGSFELDQPLRAATWELLVSGTGFRRDPFVFAVDPVRGCEPLAIKASRTQCIAARVVDEHGAPVEGAAFATEDGGASGTSDANGSLLLWPTSACAPTTRVLLRDAGPCESDFAPPTVAWGSSVQLALRRGTVLRLEVVDDARAPVESFAVLLAAAGSRRARDALPRSPGDHPGGRLAILDAQRGRNTLRVLPTAPDLLASEPQAIDVGGDGDAPRRVVLERLRPCRVEVVAGSAPAAGSAVDLVRIGCDRSAAETEAVDPRGGLVWYPEHRTAEIIGRGITDARGAASVLAPASTAGCLLRATGAHLPLFVDAPALSPSAALRVAATAGGGLRGRADLHGELAEPFGATLLDAGGRAVRPECGPWQALGADGAFGWTQLPAGRYRLQLVRCVWWSADGAGWPQPVPLAATRSSVDVAAGAATEVVLDVDVAAAAPARVRGRVRIDGDDPGGIWPAGIWHLSLVRTDCNAARGALPLLPDGSFVADGVLPGQHRFALSRTEGGVTSLPAQFGEPFDVPPGAELVRDATFVRRRLALVLQRPDGTGFGPDAGTGAGRELQLRCGTLVRTVRTERDGTLVLDPSPELAVQVRLAGGEWSAPVSMPQERREHSATVAVPMAK